VILSDDTSATTPETDRCTHDAADHLGVTFREDVVETVRAAPEVFAERHQVLHGRYGLDAELRRRAAKTSPETVNGDQVRTGYDDLSGRERRLVWRLWTLDTAPLGLTLTGPAFADNPVVYATRTLRDLTGYTAADLLGENPRLFQGPETEREAVTDLREAVASWNEVTVTVTNTHADGTSFRNRVTLAPLSGTDGTVTHWLGVQERVEA
jgi:PAS domain S-box-containing protein